MHETELSRIALVLLLCAAGGGACVGEDDRDASATDTGSSTVADGTAPGTCEPACVGSAECFEGQLCQSDATNLGGACGGTLAFPDPQCDACVRETCCAELQGCFGDETVRAATVCAEHYACVTTNAPDCSEAVSFAEYEACAAQTPSECSGTAEQHNAVQALRACALDCGCHPPPTESDEPTNITVGNTN